MPLSTTSSLLLTFGCILNINAKDDSLKYTGPKLTLAQNDSFSNFYFIQDSIIYNVNETDIRDKYFPKCCPPKYRYHTLDRKCVRSNETDIFEVLSLDVNLIKSGLRECEVLVDHIVEINEIEKLMRDDGSVEYGSDTFTLGRYCIDGVMDEEKKSILRTCYGSDYCIRNDTLRCLKKCCRDGEIFLNKKCRTQPEYGFPIEPYRGIISNATENFAIFSQRRSCVLYRSNISDDDKVNIFENGSVAIRGKNSWTTYPVQEEKYCFETMQTDSISSHLFFCINDDRNDIRFTFGRIAKIISCGCFLLTMAIYTFLYKLEKVVHRIVFCYCLAQLIGFGTLTYLQIEPHQQEHCKTLALIVMFGMLAGFAWLNVMCYDMWKTLGSIENKVGDMKRGNLKKILYYSLYAWSAPTILTVFCYFENKYTLLPPYLHVHIGEKYCILEKRLKEGNYSHAMLFILPITLLMIANIIFFSLTIRYIHQAADNINNMTDSRTKKKNKNLFRLKKKTCMTLKLYLIMGINWSFEAISEIVDFNANPVTHYIEIALDTFNCCQGVFVFLIFILKLKYFTTILGKIKVAIVSSVRRSISITSSSV